MAVEINFSSVRGVAAPERRNEFSMSKAIEEHQGMNARVRPFRVDAGRGLAALTGRLQRQEKAEARKSLGMNNLRFVRNGRILIQGELTCVFSLQVQQVLWVPRLSES